MNRRYHLFLFVFAGYSVFLNTVTAAPKTLYDSGMTHSLRPYMQSRQAPPQQTLNQSTQFVSKHLPVKRLPVITSQLTPGRVKARTIHYPYLDTPFFIVGADRLSHQWLIEHREQLKTLHAIGIAVNVNSERQLALLQRSAGGIRISPVKGGKLARQLSLKHYPVLISGKLIEQ